MCHFVDIVLSVLIVVVVFLNFNDVSFCSTVLLQLLLFVFYFHFFFRLEVFIGRL